MLQLNSSFRGICKSTDVLSFPQMESRESSELPNFQTLELVLGDVVINTKMAAARAVESGISLHDEINRLLVHGILHLIGYDHEGLPDRASYMRKKEKELIHALKKMV